MVLTPHHGAAPRSVQLKYLFEYFLDCFFSQSDLQTARWHWNGTGSSTTKLCYCNGCSMQFSIVLPIYTCFSWKICHLNGNSIFCSKTCIYLSALIVDRHWFLEVFLSLRSDLLLTLTLNMPVRSDMSPSSFFINLILFHRLVLLRPVVSFSRRICLHKQY